MLYDINDYPKYDNYDAIDIGKYNKKGEWVADVYSIPAFYNGVMGVPISFIDKYCPDQFEILALGTSKEHYTPTKQYVNPKKYFTDGRTLSANEINSTLVYPITEEQIKKVYYKADNSDKLLFQPFARILIRRKEGN